MSNTGGAVMEAKRPRSIRALAQSRAVLRNLFVATLFIIVAGFIPQRAHADNGGISFWLPGAFGSLAATPLTPGWSLGTIYLHADVSGGGDVAASRAIHFPK